jgi:tripartite-type tricarboxylate transporter receptor subunit TctC
MKSAKVVFGAFCARLAVSSAALGLAAALAIHATPARADADYPNQQIRIFSGLAAGGGADIITRYFAAKLQEQSGQTVVVINRPGAGGNFGAAAAAQSKPDGYSLLIAPNAAFAGNLYLYKDVPYHPIKSFEPITTLTSLAFIFAIPPDSKISNIAELIAYVKSKNGRATYAGNTTTATMTIEHLMKLTGASMTRVPYKSLLDTIPDVANGTLDLIDGDSTALVGQAKQGRVKLLAATTGTRSPSFPNLPTVAEQGFPGFDIGATFSVYAPAGTPPDIVAKLEGWFNKTVKSEETRAFLANVATDPNPGSSETLKKQLAEEVVKWRELMIDAKIDPQ